MKNVLKSSFEARTLALSNEKLSPTASFRRAIVVAFTNCTMTGIIDHHLWRWVVMAMLYFANSVQSQSAGELLFEAARRAIEAGDRTGFSEVANGAAAAALAFVNVRVYVLRREIATAFASGDIDGTTAARRYETLTDIQNILEIAKNHRCPETNDCGCDPFFGRFTSSVQLGLPLPSSIPLTPDSGTTVAYFRFPAIWNGESSNPTVLEANITVNVPPQPEGNFELSSFSFELASFLINGIPTGITTIAPRPNAPQGTFFFTRPVSGTLLEFEAHFEEISYNNLYARTNPMVGLVDVQGYMDIVASKVWLMASDPFMAPGVPGVPTETGLARMDVGVRGYFDVASKTLTFGENTNLSLTPDVTMVRDTSGVYTSFDQREPIIGANFMIAPLTYVGQDTTGTYRFSDTTFRISDSSGTYASGTLTNIHIDTLSCELISEVTLDNVQGQLSSPFIDQWKSLTFHEIRSKGPVFTIDLIAGTEGFTANWTTNSFWISVFGSNKPITSNILLEAKILLEGPYDPNNNQMTSTLNTLGGIPRTSPYPEDSRAVTNIPPDITDWVLVQLRSTSNRPAVASRSAFLHKDGRIVADDGTTGQIGMSVADGNYFIVVKHRNHLAVMSANAVALSSGSSTLYDFTTAQSQAFGTDPMKELESGVFGMLSGDGNGDGGVDAKDKNLVWRPQNGTLWDYTKWGDYDLDGGIDARDLNLRWRPNNGKGTQVP
jgi:hypothetical protein